MSKMKDISKTHPSIIAFDWDPVSGEPTYDTYNKCLCDSVEVQKNTVDKQALLERLNEIYTQADMSIAKDRKTKLGLLIKELEEGL